MSGGSIGSGLDRIRPASTFESVASRGSAAGMQEWRRLARRHIGEMDHVRIGRDPSPIPAVGQLPTTEFALGLNGDSPPPDAALTGQNRSQRPVWDGAERAKLRHPSPRGVTRNVLPNQSNVAGDAHYRRSNAVRIPSRPLRSGLCTNSTGVPFKRSKATASGAFSSTNMAGIRETEDS